MEGWRPLHRDHDHDLVQHHSPKLFVKFAACHSGYHCSLTDLTRLWDETLSIADMTRRAERDLCSISLRDDATQLDIFYNKIRSAFHHHPGTAIKLNLISERNNPDDLILSLSAPLPEPLPKFAWKMRLTPHLAPSDLLLAPALQLAISHQSTIQNYTLQLRQKDHVIQKLLDTVESANLPLENIFMLPRFPLSKKVPQRDQFAIHVPGLAPFEPSLPQHAPDFSFDSLTQVLENMPTTNETLAASLKSEPGWWHHLDKLDQFVGDINPSAIEKRLSTEEDDTTDDDGGQTYPPSSKQDPAMMKQVASTETPATKTAAAARHRLGALGGRRAVSKVSTAGTADSGNLSSTAESELGEARHSPVKRRLGALGGHRAISTTASKVSENPSRMATPEVGKECAPPSDIHNSPIESSPMQEQAVSARIGQQEARGVETEDGSRESLIERARATSEERANAKREELKKQLEEKAKAPAKKKRRF